MTDTHLRERLVLAVERIADALEAANASDPFLAISKALEANDDFSAQMQRVTDVQNMSSDDMARLGREAIHLGQAVDANEVIPDHIKPLIAR